MFFVGLKIGESRCIVDKDCVKGARCDRGTCRQRNAFFFEIFSIHCFCV